MVWISEPYIEHLPLRKTPFDLGSPAHVRIVLTTLIQLITTYKAAGDGNCDVHSSELEDLLRRTISMLEAVNKFSNSSFAFRQAMDQIHNGWMRTGELAIMPLTCASMISGISSRWSPYATTTSRGGAGTTSSAGRWSQTRSRCYHCHDRSHLSNVCQYKNTGLPEERICKKFNVGTCAFTWATCFRGIQTFFF